MQVYELINSLAPVGFETKLTQILDLYNIMNIHYIPQILFNIFNLIF